MKNKTALVLFAFGFSGASALIYEVVWTRALSLVLGSTTYALSAMLSTFMAGLALGGHLGGKLADRRNDLLRLFGLSEAGIGIFGLLTVPLIYALPPVYLTVYRAFHLTPAVFLGFQFFLCSAVMLVPTTLMGVTFPLVSRSITSALEDVGKKVGNAYAANTLGAILGAFSAGFILLPHLGIKAAAFIAAGMNLIVAAAVIVIFSEKKRIIVGIVVLFTLSGIAAAYSEEKSTFITFYTAHRFPDNIPIRLLVGAPGGAGKHELLYYQERAEGSVRLYRDTDGYLILQTGGKIEGTTKGDMPNTLLLAYLPIASHRGPQNFLVVGLGTGVTLMAAKQHVNDVDVAEINPGVVEAIKKFGPSGLLDGVGVHINDARQYLLLTDKKYDIISSEPSYPAESSIANLFTREYYQMAKERLGPGGIYCQWLPYYFLGNNGMALAVKTFGSVFEHVYVWKVGDTFDRLMLGSAEPFAFSADDIVKRVNRLNKTEFPLALTISREPRQVAELVRQADIPINTDDMPRLEFTTVNKIIKGRNE